MMIDRKDTPAPSMRRVVPPQPLSLRPAAPNKGKDTTPQTPTTPKNKIRTKRASKLHGPTPRETYMEGNARGHADDTTRGERISHDLSLTDNGRHSVVDNMLMSLNPDQPKPFSPPKHRPSVSSGSESTAPPKSAHRHLHSSPCNSDFSFPSDDSPYRFSGHLPRGRRSNSSSNFPTTLQRIDSIHYEGETSDSTKAKVDRVPGAGAGRAEKPLRPGRKSGKGSGSSSIDLGHMGPLRSQLGHARRSASFDHTDRSRVLHSSSTSSTNHQPPASRSQPAFYDDVEVAPTPTVPGGPRKDRSTLFPPQPGSSTPTIPRRNSINSSKNQTSRKKKDTEFLDPPIPPPANTFVVGSKRASKQVTPATATGFLKSGNQSPIRQYSEPLMAHRIEANATTKDAMKDRPGFFRRVFGSSRNDANSTQTQSTKHTGRASSKEGFTSNQKTPKSNALEDFSHHQLETAQPPLIKKPSSFFRRRKKSVSEQRPPPVLPPQLYTRAAPAVDSGQRSPTSSLRQVMNPYLDNPVRSDARQFAGTLGHENGPPQTYTLQAKGSVDPVRHDRSLKQDHSVNTSPHHPHDHPPMERARLKIDELYSSPPHDNSFFHDNSSNETGVPGVSDNGQLTRRGTVNLEQTPISVPVGRTTGKENTERTADSRGRETVYKRPAERWIDLPRHQDILSARSGNVPPSPRTTPSKSEAREWLTPSQFAQPSPSASMKDTDRVWLQPEISSKDVVCKQEVSIPVQTSEVSARSDHHSTSSLPQRKAKDDIHFPEPTTEDTAHKLSVDIDPTQPNDFDRVQAQQLFTGDESLVSKSLAAAWLGEPDAARSRVRQAYMELFEWKDLNILAALRGLCAKLYLKGEAQQVDRVLDAFSARWCACNPNHGFKATDVVHTICYSILLLNTDLHQAEIETKMTRTQFLKNILPTVRRVVTDAAPDAFVNPRASTLPPQKPWTDSSRISIKPSTTHDPVEPRRSFESQRPIYRLSQRPSDQTAYSSTSPHTQLDFSSSLGDSGPLVKTSFHGRLSTWENQVEIILKDFYNSIRQQPLPLHGTDVKDAAPETPQTTNSLSAMTSNMLRRTPSMLSKAGSENISYSRGRLLEGRLGTSRWQSKNRSRPKLYPAASSMATSRRSSFDEQSSVTTPSVTSAWSKFSSLGKTQTSLSIDSLASSYPQGDYQQSIGFANALSQAIIREEGTGGEEQSLHAAPLLEDESLELAGAPWAKEGILKHKHHLDAVEKKAKDRNWVESFAVIEKGYMRLFSFSMSARSLRNKAKNQLAAGGVVGGGNWADSAETLGTFLLRQTIASALPPPGYSKARPHVWALSLPTGAVHLFQVGTPEIVKEFVATANYWSARLSKEPMVGGISNIEYGWGESVINTALVNADRNTPSAAGGNTGAARPSLQSSIRSARSSMDQGAFRPRLPGDKIHITDWTPPQQSMVASVLMEVDQLKALSTYVKNIEDELEKHNELRAAMLLAFSPRHPNSIKAMTNWERKSSYLLREIVKFRTYIDTLEAAQKQKDKIYAERASAQQPVEEPPTGTSSAVE